MRRILCLLVMLVWALCAHAERDFSGTTASGAYYRIAVPDSWQNGDTLVLFQHGLSFDPPAPNPDLGPIADLQLSEGYAVAASSYSQRSWALFTAFDDNAELLAAFKQQVGTPGAIIPYGGSLGGLIALKMAEDPRFAPVPGRLCGLSAGGRFARLGCRHRPAPGLRRRLRRRRRFADRRPAVSVGVQPERHSGRSFRSAGRSQAAADADSAEPVHRRQPAEGYPQRRDAAPSRRADGSGAHHQRKILRHQRRLCDLCAQRPGARAGQAR